MTAPSLTDEQGRRYEIVGTLRGLGGFSGRKGDLIVRRAPEGGEDERRRLTQLVADAVNNDRPIYDVVTDILAILAAARRGGAGSELGSAGPARQQLHARPSEGHAAAHRREAGRAREGQVIDLDALLKRHPLPWAVMPTSNGLDHFGVKDGAADRSPLIVAYDLPEDIARLLAAAPAMMRAIQKLDALQTSVAMGTGNEGDETGMVMEWMRQARESLP